jgi:hypothetical protein
VGSPTPSRVIRRSAIPDGRDRLPLWRQPGARRDDQRLDAGLQGRTDDRRRKVLPGCARTPTANHAATAAPKRAIRPRRLIQ